MELRRGEIKRFSIASESIKEQVISFEPALSSDEWAAQQDGRPHEENVPSLDVQDHTCARRKEKQRETKGAVVFYLSHTLSSLLFLIQGGGVQGFIGNEIRALNVINGFDFWNGS